MTADTRFGGKCPHCERWNTSRQADAHCRACGQPVTLTADQGQSIRQPLILSPEDLDLSQLRAHVREMHGHDKLRGKGAPRSNMDLAGWHHAVHWRQHLGHLHGGPFVMVRSRHTGSTVGVTARPLGWYTGQDAKTREQLHAEFRERIARATKTQTGR